MSQVFDSVEQIDFEVKDLPVLDDPRRVFMVSPDHYDVEYAINPHMTDQRVHRSLAFRQWDGLRQAYLDRALPVEVMEGQPGLPDIVFVANHGFPYVNAMGEHKFLLSRMRHPERQGEIPHFETFVSRLGYEAEHLDGDYSFEGQGDLLWHAGRKLLWGGYGHRTQRAVYDEIAERVGAPLVAVELVSDYFYHLDVCFCPLNETTALYYPEAFTEEGQALFAAMFENLIVVSHDEAMQFACNAYCFDQKHVVIQKNCVKTIAALIEHDFEPVPVDLSEFIKAGGNVTCLRLPVYA